MRSSDERKNMVDPLHKTLSIKKQLKLVGISRSSFYYVPKGESEEDLEILRLLDEQYFKTPFYGVLRLTALLAGLGYKAGRKRVRRLMRPWWICTAVTYSIGLYPTRWPPNGAPGCCKRHSTNMGRPKSSTPTKAANSQATHSSRCQPTMG